MSTLAAVIGNYEGEQLLHDVLASLAGQTRELETIVVDAQSRDRSVEVARARGARTLVVPNRGLGYLYNRGVDATTAEYVLLLNNDVALEPDCAGHLAAALAADPSRFCADARQLDWTGERTIHARTTLSRGRFAHEYLPGLHLDHNVPAAGVVETVCANGAAMMVRRSQFLELGGFDETFFMEWEDLDLCWRAWLRGWPTVYVDDAIVRHRVGGVTNAAVAPRRAASSHHNLVRFALKCLPPAAAGRVLVGEAMRLPRHAAAVGGGLAASAREAREIAALRRALRPSSRVFEDLLEL